MRGIRGAITVEENSKDKIYDAVKLMTMGILRTNHIDKSDIVAVIFSATPDVTAAFPAAGARQIDGFDHVPLFDTVEMDVDGSLPMCIRALVLVNSELSQEDIHHIYMGGAIPLRPDLARA